MAHASLFTQDVLKDFDGLARRVDALLDAAASGAARAGSPVVDVRETQEGWLLSADLPGVDPRSLSVYREGDEIVLRGEPGTTESEGGWKLVRRERRSGAFERRLRFARPIDVEGIQARFVDGVLTVAIPRSEPTAIPITVES